MPLSFHDGSIFESTCEALVSPVNCVGVSGAGLAKEFARRYPAEEKEFVRWCRSERRVVGDVLVVPTAGKLPRWIVYVTTKGHWQESSHLASIERGLDELMSAAQTHSIPSIAVPALGCGLGGLSWSAVRPLIVVAVAATLDTVRVDVYEPVKVARCPR